MKEFDNPINIRFIRIMTTEEYDQKKRECWKDFCHHIVDEEEEFYNMFDRAYSLGKQENDMEDTMIQGWVARSKDCPNDLGLRVYTVKPDRRENRNGWNGHGEMSYLIDCRLFPDLTWESDPQEVEIIIKRKKK